MTTEADDEAGIAPPDAPLLDFVPVPEVKTSKNRIHLDLATQSATEHADLVAKVHDIGAQPIDVRQPSDADWVVFADPEGNEFCVVEPRPTYDHVGPIAEICVDTAAGAQPIAIGQRDVSWIVLADPGGNEFCVLTPRS